MIKYIFLLLIIPSFCFSQEWCSEGFIELNSQQEIDAFPSKYPGCKQVHSIRIDDNKGLVYNLDSLAQIKRVRVLFIGFIPSLESISGLNNLTNVDVSMRFYQLRHFPPFLKLDTIQRLIHEMYQDSTLDLSVYKNVKHIEAEILCIGNGRLSGLPNFTSNPDSFNMSVRENNIENNITNLIPSNAKRLIFLTLINVPKTKLTNETKTLQYIENLRFYGNVPVADSLKHIKIDAFVCAIDIGSTIFNVNSLKGMLFFRDTLRGFVVGQSNIISLHQILPNLKYLRENIVMQKNMVLSDISLIKDFELPEPNKFLSNSQYKGVVSDNPSLDICNIDFLCRWIERDGDSLLIQNNGPNCFLEKIKEDCISSSIDQTININQSIILYPNPATQSITVQSPVSLIYITISDLSGKMWTNITKPNEHIDISSLPKGMYVATITTETNQKVRHKFVKME